MMDIGRVCKKIAGRDAGLLCVIVDIDKNGRAVVDGETRRKAVNMRHLLALEKTLDITKGASHAQVATAFKKMDVEVRETKAKHADEKPGKAVKKMVEETEDAAKGKAKPDKKADKKTAKEKKPAKK
jgi:large subunit ribosomal protein L14e